MEREKMVKWAVEEFREYGVMEEEVRWGVEIVSRMKWYNSEQRVMKGIRDYLYEVKGYEIPMRIGRYKKLED